MGEPGRTFEVTPDKQLVWNAIPERNTHSDSGWVPQPIYRAHYASSLYPCYFSCQLDKDTLGNRDSYFSIRIFNVGTESDSYTINITSTSDSFNQGLTTQSIQAGTSQYLKITANKHPSAKERIEIAVTSNTNTDLKRNLVVNKIN